MKKRYVDNYRDIILPVEQEEVENEFINLTFQEFINSIKINSQFNKNNSFRFTKNNLEVIGGLMDKDINLFIAKFRQVGATTLLALYVIYNIITIKDYKIAIPNKLDYLFKKIQELIIINQNLSKYKKIINDSIFPISACNHIDVSDIIIDNLSNQRISLINSNLFKYDRIIVTSANLQFYDRLTNYENLEFEYVVMV